MPDLLDPDELRADLADDLVEFRPQEAQLVRVTLLADGYGGHAATDTTVATVMVRTSALTGRELWTAGKVAPDATYAVTAPYGTNITAADAFLIDGTRYEVLFVPDETYAVELRCLCKVVG